MRQRVKTNGYVYINLQLSSYVNDLLTYLFGFCCFFGTIKFVRFFRLNHRLSLFGKTLKYAGKELRSFSLMFLFLFISFVCLFYLLFNSKISSCSTLSKTVQMLFEMILLKFIGEQLIETAPILGPISLTLFIFMIFFISTGIFLSIINESFRHANILSSIPPTLTKLSFISNEITESSLETFLTFLDTNRTLKQLGIDSNPIFNNFYSDDNICAKKLRNAEEQNNICKFTDVY